MYYLFTPLCFFFICLLFFFYSSSLCSSFFFGAPIISFTCPSGVTSTNAGIVLLAMALWIRSCSQESATNCLAYRLHTGHFHGRCFRADIRARKVRRSKHWACLQAAPLTGNCINCPEKGSYILNTSLPKLTYLPYNSASTKEKSTIGRVLLISSKREEMVILQVW